MKAAPICYLILTSQSFIDLFQIPIRNSAICLFEDFLLVAQRLSVLSKAIWFQDLLCYQDFLLTLPVSHVFICLPFLAVILILMKVSPK